MSVQAAAPTSLASRRSSEAEWQARVDLAGAYRLAHHFGMDDLIWNHISARVPGREDHFLINPLGVTYDEITASGLVKIDLDGKVVEGEQEINYTGFIIHGAIHARRHDVGCVMHTHTPGGLAVSALKQGLMPVVQDAFIFHRRIAYHDYEGVSVDPGECERLAASLGHHKAMILRNHGLLTCGATVGEAFVMMYYLEKACRAQLAALQTGCEIHLPPEAVVEKAAQQSARFAAGKYEWPALLRLMDRKDPSFRS